jgi:hypothetical protein
MEKEIKADKTIMLKKLMKVRKTKNITYKGIYSKFGRQLVE